MCKHRVTKVSAPLGQFSTKSSSSGEFIPIPRIYRDKTSQLLPQEGVATDQAIQSDPEKKNPSLSEILGYIQCYLNKGQSNR